MEPGSSIPAAKPASTGKNRKRQPVSILVACVLIATILWFLRALENEYTTRIEHPVRYINYPEKMIAMNPLPQRISLEVKGLGFSILKHNWDISKSPLIIDFRRLRSASSKRKKGQIEYIAMTSYTSEFSTQLKDLRVITIKPDTLLFRFSEKRSLRLPVMVKLEYESGVNSISDSLIKIQPDSVTVEGPELILDTLQAVWTLPVKVNKQMLKFSRMTPLVMPHHAITLNPEEISVSYRNNN